MKSCTSLRYARRVFSLRIFPNHSIAGGTAASRWNSAAVSARARSLTTRAVLLSSCPSLFCRLLPMIIYFIRGKLKHEIHSFSQDPVSVSRGDDLTRALLFVVLQRLHLCARIQGRKTYSLSSSCILL